MFRNDRSGKGRGVQRPHYEERDFTSQRQAGWGVEGEEDEG